MSYVKHLFVGAIVRLFATTHFGWLLLICSVFVYWQEDLSPGWKAIAIGLVSIVGTLAIALYRLFSTNLTLREAQFEQRTKTIEDTLKAQAEIVQKQAEIIEVKHKMQAENVNVRAQGIEDKLSEQTEKLTFAIVKNIEDLRREHKELGTIITTQATADRNLSNRRHHNNMKVELAMMKQIKKLVPDCETLDESMLILPPDEEPKG